MVVADAVLYEVVEHLLGQRLAAGDTRRGALHAHLHLLVGGEAAKAARHALGHGVQVDEHRVVAERGLVQARQREHVVDERAHGLRLLIDEGGELLAIGRLHHVVLHELGVARDDLQRGLHLVAHVAGEVPAQVLGLGQLAVLLLEQALLLVDANEQRVHLLVYLIVQGVREIERVDGLHNAPRERLGQHEHEDGGHDHGHEHRHQHIAQEGQKRVARLGQADDAAVVQLHGGVHRVGAQRVGEAHGGRLAVLPRLADFGTPGVVLHGGRVGGTVVEHLAVGRDERVAGEAGELLLQRGDVRRGGRRVEVSRSVLRAGGELGLGVVLVGHIVDSGHDHAQHEDDAQRERQNAREYLAGEALDPQVRRTHRALRPAPPRRGRPRMRKLMAA